MPYIFKKYYPVRNILFFIGEGLIILAAALGATLVYEGRAVFVADLRIFFWRAMLVTCICQICLYYFDLYDLRHSVSAADLATRITQALGVACIALAVIYFLFPGVMISPKILLIGYLIVCASIAAWRFFYMVALERKMFTQSLLILGTGELAQKITDEIVKRRDSGYRIVAFSGNAGPLFRNHGAPVFHEIEQLSALVKEHRVEKIVVALDDKRGRMPVSQLLECRVNGTPVLNGIDFCEALSGKIMVEKTNPAWFVFSEGFRKSRLHLLAKRLIDICASFVGLLLALPIIVCSAIIIKLESKGPVFYMQERVGEKGKTFKVVKFRSMREDAEADGPVWAREDDDRVTRYGRFIRKVRIDEIPQMWTVFRGDMSFVGPRPERPVFVKKLQEKIPYYSLRHSVKPGITGWAQICYPYGASEEDALRKLEYDLYYIKNMTIWMDIMITFQTIKIVLFQKGAR